MDLLRSPGSLEDASQGQASSMCLRFDSVFAPAVKKCRLGSLAAPKNRLSRTASNVWEVNAGWIVWSDDAVDIMTRAPGKCSTRPGIPPFGGLAGFESCSFVELAVIATSSPHSGH
jgi:hypothetical protein